MEDIMNAATLLKAMTALPLVAMLALAGCGGGGGTAGGPQTPGGGTPSTMPAFVALAGLPSNHGLSPMDEFTVQPGATAEHGNVEFACPSGGPACVVRVASDGSIEYERTGGVPSTMSASMTLAGLPSNHGLSPMDEFTVQPGATAEHGNVEFACPSGGPACVVRVASDGSIEYERTGGVPSTMSASMTLAGLPSNHGLSPMDEFTVQPGATAEHGNVEFACPSGGPACVVRVASDGSVEYDRTGGVPSAMSAFVILPGLGLSVSSSDPVLASTDADTLEQLLANPASVFPALSAGLYRVYVSGSEGTTLSTDFAVNTIQMNTQGDYIISYVLDGAPGTVTVTKNDATRPNNYMVNVNGTPFYFWPWTQTRNDPFFRYMDAFHLTPDFSDGNFRSWFIFGARTDALPATGNATYRGRFQAETHLTNNPDFSERQRISGAMRLVANFDLRRLQGQIDAIRSEDSSRNRADWTTSNLEITDGKIRDGQFTATLVGMDSDSNSSFDESVKGFMGSVLGEFYGPNADEVGAVVAAHRDVIGQNNDRVLYGYIGGKNINSYSQEILDTGLAPLSGKVFGGGKKALIVMAHGDTSSGGPSDYMYRHAEAIAKQYPDVTVAAILRPGYFDAEGRVSPGSNHGGRDQYTAENNRYLATTIQNLKDKITPEQVIGVGHSGGAVQFGAILGQYENLLDGIILVGCGCDLVQRTIDTGEQPRVNSQSPVDVLGSVDRTVKVITVTGSEDFRQKYAEAYVEALRDRLVDAEAVTVEGAEHGYTALLAQV